MEDANLYTKKQQKQLNQANPSKFYYHFLYKAIIVSTFLIILALFPSQAPDFVNQTLNTRGWEFLHLVFVGIAISYGLFSRRNDDEPDKLNNNSNAQSYVCRMLQVSSIFGEEAESPTGPSPSFSDEEKFQSWSNQYYRNDNPVVVVAEESPVIVKEEEIKASEKPLLLPVRRLKSHSLGDKVKDQVVAPSPSPWRSIPGRIDIQDDDDDDDDDDDRPIRPLPSISSPRKLDSSASFSLDTRGKIEEDFVRKKSVYRPPPPPPPPPPQLFRKAVSMKQSYRVVADQEEDDDDDDDDHDQVVYPEKDLRRGFSGEESKGLNFPRSVRTVRSRDWLSEPRKDKDSEIEEEVEEDNAGGTYAPGEVSGSSNEDGSGPGSSGDGGPDVDKKADEFIARFREQIRLQRIESIKRSTVKLARKSSR